MNHNQRIGRTVTKLICEGRQLVDGKEQNFAVILYGDFPMHRIPIRVRKKLDCDSVYITKVTKETSYKSMPLEMFDKMADIKADSISKEIIYHV